MSYFLSICTYKKIREIKASVAMQHYNQFFYLFFYKS